MVTDYIRGETYIKWLLSNYVWYIMPSANPDGYMFSRQSVSKQCYLFPEY